MPAAFLISYESADPGIIRLGTLYWKHGDDGRWSHTVSEIADRFSIASYMVSKYASESTPAFVISRRCSDCGLPFRVRNRTELASLEKDSTAVCFTCRENTELIARKERESQVKAEYDERQKRLQYEQAAGRAIWTRMTTTSPVIDYWAASYEDIISSFTLFNCSAVGDDLQVKPYALPPFAPTEDLSRDIMRQLHDSGILHFGSDTPIDAFVPDAEGTRFRYYPHKIRWRFAAADESDSLGRLLGTYIDDPTDDVERWIAIKSLWWKIGRTESKRYLRDQLERYNLDVKDSDALDAAVDHGLERFSIPCLRNLLWQVAKDAAAYSARVDVVRRQAINSIPGAVIRKVDRALSGGWTVNPYVRKWDEEECALTTTLFDRVLQTGRDGFGYLTGRRIDYSLAEAEALATNEQASSG